MVEYALEMATEIRAEECRQYSLASMITMVLDKDTIERGAAEILEDRLANQGQLYRLIDTLETIKREVAA